MLVTLGCETLDFCSKSGSGLADWHFQNNMSHFDTFSSRSHFTLSLWKSLNFSMIFAFFLSYWHILSAIKNHVP